MDFFKGIGNWFGGLFGKKKKPEEQRPVMQPTTELNKFGQPMSVMKPVTQSAVPTIANPVTPKPAQTPVRHVPGGSTITNKFGQPESVYKEPEYIKRAKSQLNAQVTDFNDYYKQDADKLRHELNKGADANQQYVEGLTQSLKNRQSELADGSYQRIVKAKQQARLNNLSRRQSTMGNSSPIATRQPQHQLAKAKPVWRAQDFISDMESGSRAERLDKARQAIELATRKDRPDHFTNVWGTKQTVYADENTKLLQKAINIAFAEGDEELVKQLQGVTKLRGDSFRNASIHNKEVDDIWRKARGTVQENTQKVLGGFSSAAGNAIFGEDTDGDPSFNWSDPKDYGRFIANLPAGMLSAPVSAADSVITAGAGSKLERDEAGNFKDKELNNWQKLGYVADALISTYGLNAGASGQLLRAGASEVTKQSTKKAIASLIKGALSEGIEEGVQTLAQDLADDGRINKPFSEYRDSVALGTLGGAVMGGAEKLITKHKLKQQLASDPHALDKANGIIDAEIDQQINPLTNPVTNALAKIEAKKQTEQVMLGLVNDKSIVKDDAVLGGAYDPVNNQVISYGQVDLDNIQKAYQQYGDSFYDHLSHDEQVIYDDLLDKAPRRADDTYIDPITGEVVIDEIVTRNDGSKYVRIDNNIIEGIDSKPAMQKAVKNHIRNNFQGNSYDIGETGESALVTRRTKNEIAHQQRIMSNIDYKIKARMSGNLNELIENMQDVRVVPNHKPEAKPAVNHYLSGRTEVEVDGELYYPRIDIEVGHKGNMIAYDIADIKKEPRAESDNRSYIRETNSVLDNQGSVSVGNIAQVPDNVNKNAHHEHIGETADEFIRLYSDKNANNPQHKKLGPRQLRILWETLDGTNSDKLRIANEISPGGFYDYTRDDSGHEIRRPRTAEDYRNMAEEKIAYRNSPKYAKYLEEERRKEERYRQQLEDLKIAQQAESKFISRTAREAGISEEAVTKLNNGEKYRERNVFNDRALSQSYNRMSNGGYNAEHMISNRAIDAMRNGRFPAEEAAMRLGLKPETIEEFVPVSEWHHMGEDATPTDFYDMNDLIDAAGDLLQGDADPTDSSVLLLKKMLAHEEGVKYQLNQTEANSQFIEHNLRQILGDEYEVVTNRNQLNGEPLNAQGYTDLKNHIVAILDGKMDTGYHEAGHVVFNALSHVDAQMTDNAITSIIKHYGAEHLVKTANKAGYDQVVGHTLDFNNEADVNLAAEEQLMNDFARYAEAKAKGRENYYAKTNNLPTRIKQWFDNVIAYLKDMVGRLDAAHDFMYRAERGDFAQLVDNQVRAERGELFGNSEQLSPQVAYRIYQTPAGKVVEIEGNPLKGVPIQQIPAKVRQIIKERFQGKEYNIGDTDQTARVTARSKNEIAYQQNKMSNEQYRTKAMSAHQLDELISSMENVHTTPNRKKATKPDVVSYTYGDVTVKIGDRFYDALVNVENWKSGKSIIYDISNIKETPPQRQTLLMGGGVHASSVAQDPNNVKYLIGGEQATGFVNANNLYGGLDGRTKFEFDDSKAEWSFSKDQKPSTGKKSLYKLGDIFSHDELYKQYPEAKDITVRFVNRPRSRAGGHVSEVDNLIEVNWGCLIRSVEVR